MKDIFGNRYLIFIKKHIDQGAINYNMDHKNMDHKRVMLLELLGFAAFS